MVRINQGLLISIITTFWTHRYQKIVNTPREDNKLYSRHRHRQKVYNKGTGDPHPSSHPSHTPLGREFPHIFLEGAGWFEMCGCLSAVRRTLEFVVFITRSSVDQCV